MEYVEILRARRALIWLGALLIVGLVIEQIAWFYSSGHNRGNGTENFSSFVGAASFGGIFIATFLVSGLSTEAAQTTPLIWTRPVARDAIAWRYVAVDAVAIVIGYVMVLAAIVVGIVIVGALDAVTFDRAVAARTFLLGLGGALMWYAVVSVASARLPGRGPLLAGLSWGVFPILILLIGAPFPGWLHAVVVALNYLNPVAWLGGMTGQGNHGFVPFSEWARVMGEWLIALAAVAASVRLWATREA